jgi:hypothetical protein
LWISSNIASTRDNELIAATPFPAQIRRTSIYSIAPGIQRLGAISQGDTRSGTAHPEPAKGVSPCPPNQRSIPRVLPRPLPLALSSSGWFRRQWQHPIKTALPF